jgi:hypothetical protein
MLQRKSVLQCKSVGPAGLFASPLDAPVLVVLGLLGLVVGPALFAWIGTPPSSSYHFNMPWLVGFEAALKEGVLYPRHLPQLWYGLGGLDFFFYGPLPFYVAAGPARWLCAPCTPQTVFALQGGIFWGLSMLAVYPFLRRFAEPVAAGLASLAYALLPYHLWADWFYRQAAGEFAAYVFTPVIALGMHTILRDRRMSFAFPLGLAGLTLAHLPSLLIAVHVLGVVFLVYALLRPHDAMAAFGRLVLLGVIGVALGAVYWLPAVALLPDVSPTALYDLEIMKPLPRLFFYESLLPYYGWEKLNLYLLAVGLPVAVYLAVRTPETRVEVIAWAVAPLAVILFLNTALSAPIWEHWVIELVQFPYRMMLFADLSFALLIAWLVPRVLPLRTARANIGAAVALVLLALAIPAQVPRVLVKIEEARAAKERPVDMSAALEYMPPPFHQRTEEILAERDWIYWRTREVVAEWVAELRAEGSGVTPVTGRSRHWEAVVPAAGPVVLAIPYWRHFVAETEFGDRLALSAEEAHGLTRLVVPEGARRVVVSLPWHWSERAGLAVSAAALVALFCVSLVRAPRRRATAVDEVPAE